jgi:predicted PurR-regulated permease PerM
VIAATITVVGVCLALLVLLRFALVPLLLFVAVLIAVAIRPAVAWLERSRGSRLVAAGISHAALVALVAGFGLLALPLFVEQVTALLAGLPDQYAALRQALLAADSVALRQIGLALPETLRLAETATSFANVALARDWASTLSAGLFLATAVLVLSFYCTLDGEVTVRSVLLLVPIDRRESARELVAAAGARLAAYVRGQAFLCAVVGSLALVAYSLIGLPNAFALAIIAGVLEAIPLLGPVLGAIPALLVALAIEPVLAIWVGVAAIAIQLIENYLLVPRVMDRAVGVSPLITILAIAAFGSALGVLGALLAIPIAAMAQLVIDRFLLREESAAPRPPNGRDAVSALRYEAQDLALDIRKVVRRKVERPSATADRFEDELESIAADLDRLLAERSQEGA